MLAENRTLASEKKDFDYYGTAGLLGVMPTFISLAPHPKWAAQVDVIPTVWPCIPGTIWS